MGFLKGKTAIITGGGRAVLSDGSCGSIGYGIAYNDEVICACCGGIFELDEIEILEEYEDWIDFKYEIGD